MCMISLNTYHHRCQYNIDNDDDGAGGGGVYNEGGGGNIDYYIDGGGGGNDVNITSFFLSLFENLKFLGRFGADLRILTPYRVELIDKTLIFGLDSTTNR